MSTKILLIDAFEKHREIVKRFLKQTHPNVKLVELDPVAYINTEASINWHDYFLLIIDSQLGDKNGIDWVTDHQNEAGFPAFIFLSSTIDSNSLEASIQADQAMEIGAESFLFKKHLKPDKLNYYISNALEKSGTYQSMDLKTDVFETIAAPDESGEDLSLGNTSDLEGLSLDSTFHQMLHAKALLQGHDTWPFKISDMIAGKASLGDYHINTYLGSREGIISFSAHHQKDDEPVVIKLIDRSQTGGIQPPKNLTDDLQTLIDNKHPNLVRCNGYEATDDYVMIVQELLQGKKLSTRLKITGTTAQQSVIYMLQILAGLKMLHSNGMVAGGMSPENLLFRNDKALVLTHLHNKYYPKPEKSTQNLQFNYQEALYMSPEMLQGRQTDHRSDLYIAGTIFYHMLSGAPPYHGRTTQDVIVEHTASPAPLLPDESHSMNAVIQNMMMKTPSQRTQSADEAIAAIKSRIDNI